MNNEQNDEMSDIRKNESFGLAFGRGTFDTMKNLPTGRQAEFGK